MADQQIDLQLSTASPRPWRSFSGCGPGGLTKWFPAPANLWELKQVLYDTPYPNEERNPIPRPSYQEIQAVDAPNPSAGYPGHPDLVSNDPVFLENAPQVLRLAGLPQLDTTISFGFT